MAYDKAVDSAALDAGLTSIADAIRTKGGTTGSLAFPQGFVDAIGEISGGEITPWVRPEDWPDIDALATHVADDEDCVYLTYDLRKTSGYGWIGIAARNDVNNTDWYVERGHVANGAFVADETHSITTTNRNNLTYFRQALDDADGDVQLWRVRSENHLLQVGFATNTSTNNSNFNNNMQPCVERAGKAPYLVALESGIGTANTQAATGTVWLEHDALVPGKFSIVRSLEGYWNKCLNLQRLDLQEWDTTGWAVTRMSNVWLDCRRLQKLDVSGWNTSNWQVSTLQLCFCSCYELKELDLSAWDVSNWNVTSLHWTWRNTPNLEKLITSGWDTSGWHVTTINSMFNHSGIREFDIGQWNTSSWAVTDMNQTMTECQRIEEIDLSGWNTSNWHVTGNSQFWQSCVRLKRLNLTGWNIDNFTAKGNSIFASCDALEELYGTATWTGTGVSPDSIMLKNFDGIPRDTNHSYSNCVMLTRQSLLNILNTLPTVSAARTITLGQTNKNRLTAEEIAIATAKGWTVA